MSCVSETITAADQAAAYMEITNLKARYFRFLDAQDWVNWREVFTPDAVMDKPDEVRRLIDAGFTGLDETPMRGQDDLIDRHVDIMRNIVTVHQGATAEIIFTSPTEATATWPVHDIIRQTEDGHVRVFDGYGHYHERYVRDENGQWRISFQTMSRQLYTIVVDGELVAST